MSGLLAHFVQHCRDQNKPIHIARSAILSVQDKARWLKGHLQRPWDALGSWQLDLPIQSRRPLALLFVQAMAVALAVAGGTAPQDRDKFWAAALLIRIGF